MCNGFHRFTTGVTPADVLVTCMAAEPFPIHVLVHAHARALEGPESGIERINLRMTVLVISTLIGVGDTQTFTRLL